MLGSGPEVKLSMIIVSGKERVFPSAYGYAQGGSAVLTSQRKSKSSVVPFFLQVLCICKCVCMHVEIL